MEFVNLVIKEFFNQFVEKMVILTLTHVRLKKKVSMLLTKENVLHFVIVPKYKIKFVEKMELHIEIYVMRVAITLNLQDLEAVKIILLNAVVPITNIQSVVWTERYTKIVATWNAIMSNQILTKIVCKIWMLDLSTSIITLDLISLILKLITLFFKDFTFE